MLGKDRIGERGFGLLEVIVALGIMGAALLPIIKLTIDSNYRVKEARQLTEAVNLARWKLEEQRKKEINQITEVRNKELSETKYNYRVEVEQVNVRLKRVAVKVKQSGEVKAKLTTILRKGEE